MIPIRDNVLRRTFPFFTIALIMTNFAVFVYEFSLGPGFGSFIYKFGFVPARFFRGLFTLTWNPFILVVPAFTSMFLHGSWLHVISNCWYLWIFGDNIEDRLGHARFLVFYLLCGLLALLAQALVNPYSTIPNVGASGAIAGIMGAYMFLYPKAKVIVLIPIFIFIRFIEIPALFFLGFWVFMQYLNSMSSLSARGAMQGGVAWWAHLGGFVAGAVFVWFFRKKQQQKGIW